MPFDTAIEFALCANTFPPNSVTGIATVTPKVFYCDFGFSSQFALVLKNLQFRFMASAKPKEDLVQDIQFQSNTLGEVVVYPMPETGTIPAPKNRGSSVYDEIKLSAQEFWLIKIKVVQKLNCHSI